MGERYLLICFIILKTIIAIIVLFLCFETSAQETKKIESLDSFFAGIPLQKCYEKWVEHVNSNPYLGIDSAKKSIIYTGFKPGIKSHFPYPDSVKVNLSLYSAINIDSTGKFPNDTIKTVSIQGIFGKSKLAKKQTNTYFNDLKLLLKKFYRTINDDSGFGNAAGFINGINENFPDVMIFSGYNEKQNFYYILMVCEFRQRISFKMPKVFSE
jgi:hypothetical protein